MEISDERLGEWERLCESASPGEWRRCRANEGKCKCHLIWCIGSDCVVAASMDRENEGYTCGQGVDADQANINGDFIAESRTAMPALIAEVRRQRERIAELEADAARYRYIRDNLAVWDRSEGGFAYQLRHIPGRHETFDAAIDAARSGRPTC